MVKIRKWSLRKWMINMYTNQNWQHLSSVIAFCVSSVDFGTKFSLASHSTPMQMPTPLVPVSRDISVPQNASPDPSIGGHWIPCALYVSGSVAEHSCPIPDQVRFLVHDIHSRGIESCPRRYLNQGTKNKQFNYGIINTKSQSFPQ